MRGGSLKSIDLSVVYDHIYIMEKAQADQDLPEIPTTPDQLLQVFDKIGVNYTLHHHDRAFTVAESQHLKDDIPGLHCRNLFVKDKKGAMFLVTAANETEIDMKKLAPAIGAGRLSFASAERLMTHLGIYPGAVCPFAAINDRAHDVQIVLDQKMIDADLVCVHPLDNAMTVSLSPQDLMTFLAHTGHKPQILDMSGLAAD